jgi:signal transduction histidine kinase
VDWVSTDPARADFVRAATLSAESGASRTFGNEVVGVARQLSVPGAPVVIVAEPRPPRRLWHDIFFGLNLPLAAAFGLGSALLGWWVAGLVTRPIDALAAHARAVALRSDVPPPLESAIPEVATLTAAVDRLGRRVEADSEERARISAALRRVSHEMRTPLTTLRLRVDDLAELPGASPNTVQVIEGQIDRLERLGDTLSELRTRGADAEMAAISLQVPVAAVVSRVAPLARWGQIDLRTEQLGSVQVMGDRVLLEDAVSNLVENALKHTPRGGRVRIAVGRTGDGSPMIEVTDSGPGFTTAMAHVGSHPAVRAVSAASGSGQGLAIVADTMDRHGGRLELGEAPGGGALVRLVFRADSAETHIGR